MTDTDARLEAALRAGPPEEDTYVPPGWTSLRLGAGASPSVTTQLPGGTGVMGRGWVASATAVAGALLLLVVVAGVLALAAVRRDAPPEAGASRPSEAVILAEAAKVGVEDPRLVGRASTGRHTVTFVLGQRMGYSRPEAVIATSLWDGTEPKEVAIESLDISVAHAGVLGRGVSSVDGVETVEHGFFAVWTTDERVGSFVLRSDGGVEQRGALDRPATIAPVDPRFAVDGYWRWQLLDRDGRLLYEGGDPLP